jgi:hypothetical protein
MGKRKYKSAVEHEHTIALYNDFNTRFKRHFSITHFGLLLGCEGKQASYRASKWLAGTQRITDDQIVVNFNRIVNAFDKGTPTLPDVNENTSTSELIRKFQAWHDFHNNLIKFKPEEVLNGEDTDLKTMLKAMTEIQELNANAFAIQLNRIEEKLTKLGWIEAKLDKLLKAWE